MCWRSEKFRGRVRNPGATKSISTGAAYDIDGYFSDYYVITVVLLEM